MNLNTIGGATSTSGNVSQYVPPKMWKDLSADEKIERMRETIKYLEQMLVSERGRVNNIEAEFKNHDHLNGKVVKDIKTYHDSLGGIGKLSANKEMIEKGEVFF